LPVNGQPDFKIRTESAEPIKESVVFWLCISINGFISRWEKVTEALEEAKKCLKFFFTCAQKFYTDKLLS
jgi:hypothetical protein